MKRQELETYAAIGAAQKELARRLNLGNLALFLGAGISMDYGLPSWETLVNSCCDIAGVPILAAENLQTRIDSVRRSVDGSRFVELVSESLYKSLRSKPDELDGSPLMRALAVTMMGGTRGGISDVVTVNFDSLLESHMRLHGYVTQSIHRLPDLEDRSDIRIYHPNGYLPQPGYGESSSLDELVLDSLSFDRRLADGNGPWNSLMSNILLKKIGLVVGLSTEETFVRVTVTGVAQKLEHHNRPVCFWLLSRTDSDGAPRAQVEEESERLLDRGCIPVVLNSYAEYPRFLFQICSDAAMHSMAGTAFA